MLFYEHNKCPGIVAQIESMHLKVLNKNQSGITSLLSGMTPAISQLNEVQRSFKLAPSIVSPPQLKLLTERFKKLSDMLNPIRLDIFADTFKKLSISTLPATYPNEDTGNNFSNLLNMIAESKRNTVASHDLYTVQSNITVNHEFSAAEEGSLINDRYVQEKSKGGKNSYKRYQPLRDMAQAICRQELKNKPYHSARQLCASVVKIIEAKNPKLLYEFTPYKHKKTSFDWTKPTFYEWCNSAYKAWHKENSK